MSSCADIPCQLLSKGEEKMFEVCYDEDPVSGLTAWWTAGTPFGLNVTSPRTNPFKMYQGAHRLQFVEVDNWVKDDQHYKWATRWFTIEQDVMREMS